jgi:hypothetical protein
MRAAALVVLLLDEDEDAVRRSWVVMWGRGLLKLEEVLYWLRSWRGGGDKISFGRRGSSFVLESVGDGRLEVGFCFLTTSEPEAGGVGGRARLGGGEGRGGVLSFFALDFEVSGVLGREGVAMLPLLRRFAAVRDIEADRGLGAYLLPSPRRMSLVGFGVDLALGSGTSSATSITGLRAIVAEFGLPLDVVGEFGEYPIFPSSPNFSSWDGTVDTGLSVVSVSFFQLALLEADEEVRVVSGAGLKSGIWICGRALRSRREEGGGAFTTASIVCEKPGLSRIFRCLVFSSRSFRDIGYSGCLMGLRSRDFGLFMGPVHSVITQGMINGGSTSLAYSLTLCMLGAIFGVTLRTSLEGDIRPSILLGSRHNLSGLFGGGGPGLSEKLRRHNDAAILGVRCNKTG